MTEEKIKRIVKLYQNRVENGDDIIRQTKIFSTTKLDITSDEFIEIYTKLSILKDSKDLIIGLFKKLINVDELTVDVFSVIIKELQFEYNIKGTALWHPVRLAITGEISGANLAEISYILGRDKVIYLVYGVIQMIYKIWGIIYDEI